MSDAALIARLQRNDRAAYATLAAQYGEMLFGYIYQSTLDRQQSEALLQATLVRVIAQIDGYPVHLPLFVWLYRMAQTVLRDTYIPPPHPACVPQCAGARAAAHDHAPLDALALDERQVIALRCVADLSVSEIGYVLGKSNQAVKQLHYQALRALSQALR